MIYLFLCIYTIVYVLFYIPLFVIFACVNSKARQGLIGRFSQLSKLRAFAKFHKNSEIILFHSSSVGEWEQAIPLIKEFKKINPNYIIVSSFFSPSGIKHAKKTDVDFTFYLPFDIFFLGLSMFRILRPKAWIISKYDVWPAFLYAAHVCKVPVYLCSAELAKDSTRYKGIFAKINKIFYKYIRIIFPVSEDYKNRFLQFYPYEHRLIVSGDARYDQIITKAEVITQESSVQIFTKQRTLTFIAGSIWPADEKHLLPALIKVIKKHEGLQVILVPHELHESHISAIEQEFTAASIACERYTQFLEKGTTDASVAIVDTIGMLAKLYKTTDIAYVGGAFSTGVHNIAEPAAFGNAILCGPKYINSFEATSLVERKGVYSVQNQIEVYKILSQLVSDTEFRKQTGQIAQSFLLANKGATSIIVNEITKDW